MRYLCRSYYTPGVLSQPLVKASVDAALALLQSDCLLCALTCFDQYIQCTYD